MTNKKTNSDYRLKATGDFNVEKIRSHFGIKAIRCGERLCLRCDKLFFSEDLAALKICNTCKNNGAR